MPVDQAHEQNNEYVKGSGGAVCLTENPSAFRKWMVSGPEQARLLKEFKKDFVGREDEMKYHHEEGFPTQKNFKEQAMTMADIISDLGNPFSDDSDELIALETRNVMDATVVNTIRTVESLGQEQYQRYRQAVIIDHTQSIHDPIKKNSLPLFRSPQKKLKSKQTGKMSLLKNDVSIFSHLYIVMQHRQSDMSTFFKHENHSYPPSLSDGGKLRIGKKSDLLGNLNEDPDQDPPVYFDATFLDGAAVFIFFLLLI